MSAPSLHVPVDQSARDSIRDDLDTNFLIEAGAGSGKTTALVGRMLSLIRAGLAVERIAAVTFTRKAAAELREKFQVALEEEVRDAASPELKARSEVALANLDAGFIGTIHAFCGRLLRDQALEAGVVPTFEEVDETEFAGLVDEFWGRWVERCRLEDNPALTRLAELGSAPAELLKGFKTLVENPDVTFPHAPAPAPDPAPCRARLAQLLDLADAMMPKDEPGLGWDNLQALVRRYRYLAAVGEMETLPAFAAALALLTESGSKVTQNRWAGLKEGKAAAKELGIRFEEFRTTLAADFLRAWYVHRYAVVIDILQSAIEEFGAERRTHGTLGFQDLLSLAANLLRTSDAARTSLGRQYQRLLVDEFQDTDPIQAAVCFLLASDASEGRDWRAVTPRPGALFVVGDPKQSIYRFRRADLETYAAAKEQFSRCGEVLQLTENFRSSKPVEEFVNDRFKDVFVADTPGQAPFAPMHTSNPTGKYDGIYHYDVDLGSDRVTRDNILSWEAPRLAGWIAQRIQSGERKPEDFLVLSYQRKAVGPLARALANWNIPVATAGAEVPQERELGDLLLVLKLLADPENSVLVVAVLEGLFFGLSPADLFDAKQQGIEFTLLSPPANTAHKVGAALAQLQRWLDASRLLPADLVLERILDGTGLLAWSAGLDLGDARAGLLLHLVDAVRTESTLGAGDLRGAIDAIERELETPDTSSNLRPDRGGAVRVMNLHKAKGLEAEVVVLACPWDLEEYPPLIHVRRDETGAVGYLHITDDEGDTIAHPAGWDEVEAQESILLQYERERLRYVATTRARGELVVARLKKSNKDGPREDQSIWAPLHPALARHGKAIELVPQEPPGRETLQRTAVELGAEVASAVARLQGAMVSSETTTSVTAAVHKPWADDSGDEHVRARRNKGMAWGSAVHRAIEGLGRGRTGENLKSYLRAVVRDEELGVTSEEIAAKGEKLFALLEQLRATPEWKALMASGDRRFECRVARCEDGPNGRVLTEGTLDAAFIQDGAWTVLDWKTDAVADDEWKAREAGYKAQVGRYAEVLAALGQKAGNGRVVRVR